MADVPLGFHQSAASLPKKAASSGLMLAAVDIFFPVYGVWLACHCPHPFLSGKDNSEAPPGVHKRRKLPAMARIVMKFGGTSMAGTERIRNVAARVKREVDAGNEVAVVVSAMSGETDRLVGYCREASPLADPAEYDVVVAAGEQITSGLLAITLQSLGVKARSWLGWQLPIRLAMPTALPASRISKRPPSWPAWRPAKWRWCRAFRG
jgi:hypothetical protein